MLTPRLHLMKLSVGSESVEDLTAWHATQRDRWPEGRTVHVTRMWPRRTEELLAGGSIYWVIKGTILARQRLAGFEELRGADGVLRCAIFCESAAVRTAPVPRRPFQGWRYLEPADAPRDLPEARAAEPDLPEALARALADIGLR